MSDLNLGQHISQQFNDELEDVRNKVLQMGGIVEEQLEKAVRALVRGDQDLAAEVLENDYRVNVMEVEIDEECTRIVARRQPAASDLRLKLGPSLLRSTRILALERRTGGGFIAQGAGWGHGVGLCQMGAIGQARAGRSAREIVAHYYPGAILRRAY